ncbi:MAG: PRTRC system protein C [Nitrospirae bacterium]|nr:PRTRC system protein C [Nitrospirota bacterium]
METPQEGKTKEAPPSQGQLEMRKRVFVYDGKRFPDPDPGASITQVRDVLRGAFPELAEAETQTNTLADGTEEITFRKVAGRKGR